MGIIPSQPSVALTTLSSLLPSKSKVRQADRWMDGRTDGWMDGWMFYHLIFVFLPAPTAVMFPPSSVPMLLPQAEEMVVPLHTPFTLTCRGEAKLAWDTPLDVPEKTQEDNSGLFVTTITVDSATAMHTGYYTCFYSRNNTEDAEGSQIYIYVPGMGLGAFLSCEFFKFIFIIQAEKYILPHIRS